VLDSRRTLVCTTSSSSFDRRATGPLLSLAESRRQDKDRELKQNVLSLALPLAGKETGRVSPGGLLILTFPHQGEGI
jgi:hypothetical protein